MRRRRSFSQRRKGAELAKKIQKEKGEDHAEACLPAGKRGGRGERQKKAEGTAGRCGECAARKGTNWKPIPAPGGWGRTRCPRARRRLEAGGTK